jgi:hypothetical protein
MTADRFITYKLKYPIEYGGEVITELKFRPPRGKELKLLPVAPPSDLQISHEMAGLLCGQSLQFMDLLEKPDWFAVIKVCDNFLSEEESSSGGPLPSSPASPSS